MTTTGNIKATAGGRSRFSNRPGKGKPGNAREECTSGKFAQWHE